MNFSWLRPAVWMLLPLSTGCLGMRYGMGTTDHLGGNNYEVTYSGETGLKKVKAGAVYQAAEAAWENGYRYFVVIDAEQETTTITSYGRYGGGTRVIYTINLKIKCYSKKPEKGEEQDSHIILNTWNSPGTDRVASIKERGDPKSPEYKRKKKIMRSGDLVNRL